MAKEFDSKLDVHAERITRWFTPKKRGGEGRTIAYAVEQLALDGLEVSPSTLSRWWETRESERRQANVLGLVVTGSRQCAEIDEAFAKNPEPQMATLIKLIKMLIMQLTVKGAADPDYLSLANSLTITVCNYISGQTKAAFEERKLTIEEQKFAESRKNDQAKALEACLEDAQNFPAVQELFRTAFAALAEAKAQPA